MSFETRSACTLLQVFDMPTSVRFYRDVLGFELLESSPRQGDQFDWGMFGRGDIRLMLNTAYESDSRPPAPDAARVAAHDDTCIYFGCPDVDGAYRYLRDKGLDLAPPSIAPYGMKQLYVHDPDGYALCFQWTV